MFFSSLELVFLRDASLSLYSCSNKMYSSYPGPLFRGKKRALDFFFPKKSSRPTPHKNQMMALFGQIQRFLNLTLLRNPYQHKGIKGKYTFIHIF